MNNYEMRERAELVKSLFMAGIIDKGEALTQVNNMRGWIGLKNLTSLPWGR
jgi:hypothetical protein